MSYVRFDDLHEDGRLTQFRERLSAEVRMQTGAPFAIFQDRHDIQWGQNWEQRIDQAIDATTFLIPIITPSFFRSEACIREIQRFAEREAKLGRDDLILPVYYVTCAEFNRPSLRDKTIPKLILQHQYFDWRELRFEPLNSPTVSRSFARLAIQIRDALDRRPVRQRSTRSSARGPTVTNPEPLISASTEATESIAASDGKKGRILTIGTVGSVDFRTIQEGVDNAESGDKLLVRPGLYRESILVDKNLEIIGDGDRTSIIIQSDTRSTIRFHAESGRISNLTIRKELGGSWCFLISKGKLEVEDCEIIGAKSAGIVIQGQAYPTIRRNIIRDGLSSGIYVYASGGGIIENNDIFGNKASGIDIRTLADPIVRGNRIHHNYDGGVTISVNGRGTIEDNDIFENRLSGIFVRTGSRVTIRRNRIYNSLEGGIYVNESGHATLTDNEVFGCMMNGVWVSQASEIIADSNTVRDNAVDGFSISVGSRASLTKNEAYNNGANGAGIYSESSVNILGDSYHDNHGSGLWTDNSKLVLEECTVTDNELAGIHASSTADVFITKSRITNNRLEGVWAFSSVRGKFIENDLRGNGRSAWSISPDSRPIIEMADNLE